MLSKKAQYSIYALVYLARAYDQGPVMIKEIAKNERIPKKFLESILLDLRNNGVVSSKKGRAGGYYLIKKPEEVNLADIIRLFDGALALLPCVTFRYYEECNHCKDENKCGVRSFIKDVRDETVNILKRASLAQIIEREKELEKNSGN